MSKLKTLLDPMREQVSSHQYALDTCELIKEILKRSKISSKEELKREIKLAGKKIMKVHPLEFTVENVIRRVFSIIDSEAGKKNQDKLSTINQKLQQNQDEFLLKSEIKSISDSKQQSSNDKDDFDLGLTKSQSVQVTVPITGENKSISFDLQKKQYIEEIDNLMTELTEDLQQAINVYAPSHISSNEVILTYEHSNTVEQFLIRARKERQFEVIVLLSDSNNEGQIMAENLSKAGISVFAIPFSAAYAYMPRVNKIYIGVHSIMKNGGILAKAGSLMLATVAKAYRVDFIVLGSTIKLTPHFPFDQNTYNELIKPYDILPDKQYHNDNVTVIGSKYDYLAPGYITLYITNMGEHSPSYIYRLFNEVY